MSTPYDDIISLPHHVSPTRPRMSAMERAAQFSPFAALTGYDAAVRETARTTEERAELDEDAKAALDRVLRQALDRLSARPAIRVTYFQPDSKKSGGACVTLTGRVKKLRQPENVLVLEDGTEIPVVDIYALELNS